MIRTTKQGKLFYEELIRPMEYLARRNKAMGTKKLGEMNYRMVEDMIIMNSRKPKLSH